MDGGTVWPRMPIGGKPAVYRTRDARPQWKRQDKGLPRAQAWFTVKRQAMCADALDPGRASTSAPPAARCGRASTRATSWHCLVLHLPHIYSVEAALVA